MYLIFTSFEFSWTFNDFKSSDRHQTSNEEIVSLSDASLKDLNYIDQVYIS